MQVMNRDGNWTWCILFGHMFAIPTHWEGFVSSHLMNFPTFDDGNSMGFKVICTSLKGLAFKIFMKGLRQSWWSQWEITGFDCFWLSCCIGEIRQQYGGVVRDWVIKGFSRPIIINIFFFSLYWQELPWSKQIQFVVASPPNIWVGAQVRSLDRKHGVESSGAVAMYLFLCEQEHFFIPGENRRCLILCFKDGMKAILKWHLQSRSIWTQLASVTPKWGFSGEGGLMSITPPLKCTYCTYSCWNSSTDVSNRKR